jgi:hypothetical protein
MVQRCEYAKTTFRNYFARAFNRVGLKWLPEDDAELDRAIDEIYAEAVIGAKREVFGQLEAERIAEERRRIQESFRR